MLFGHSVDMTPAVESLPSRPLGRWSSVHGVAEVASIGPNVVLVTMSGYVEVGIGQPLGKTLHRALAENGNSTVFFDLEDMTQYDPEVRVACTDAVLAHDRKVQVVTWATSALVRMGVSVANIALGGRIRSMKSRDAFETLLRDTAEG